MPISELDFRVVRSAPEYAWRRALDHAQLSGDLMGRQGARLHSPGPVEGVAESLGQSGIGAAGPYPTINGP